jgi:Calx-beta domain/RTX calcium-binding nonapeptide repeat (4 copies)
MSNVNNGYIIKQVTNNSVDDRNPQISGKNVVWEAGVNVYLLKNGSQLIVLDDSGSVVNPMLPQISGNNVAWMNFVLVGDPFLGSRFVEEIRFYDGNTTIDLPETGRGDGKPQISGNNIVWQDTDSDLDSDDWEIEFYNGSTTVQLTENDIEDENPQISGNNVVWQGDGEIYFYNGISTTQLTNNFINDTNPQISGRNITWQGDGEIYFYNGIRTIRLTNNAINDEVPQISGNNVVWQGNGEIYFYNGIRTIRLTNNNFNDLSPQISGRNIVWQGYDGTDYEIFYYNGIRTVQLTNNNFNDEQPQISGQNITWQGNDGNDSEIYLATPEPPRISISNAVALEGLNRAAVFTVSLSRASTTPITLRYTTTNQTARAGLDYRVPINRVITFRPGQLSESISIPLINNNLNEVNERFRVILTKVNPSDAIFRKAVGVGIITDTLQSRISRTLPVGVENLTLIGNRAINGTGNELNNRIIGNNANNLLSGLPGSDRLFGLAGNDILNGGLGNDVVVSGTGNDVLLGGLGNDTLNGTVGNDVLNGGLGRDVLIGGLGSDRFVFASRNQRIDRINDFLPVADTILVSARGFGGGLRRGRLPAVQFRVGAVARDANDRFIYNRATGVLSFDANGIGAGARIPIAVLDAGLAMSAADILVMA